jgi:hypothetical protein
MSDLSDEQTPRRLVDFLAVVGSVLIGVGVTGCSGSGACNHASDVVAIQWAADDFRQGFSVRLLKGVATALFRRARIARVKRGRAEWGMAENKSEVGDRLRVEAYGIT